MHPVHLQPIDYLLLVVYFVFVVGIGATLKRRVTNSADFFLAGRSIPPWITGLAFLSANLGAQEVIGMGPPAPSTASQRRTSTGSALSLQWSLSASS